MATISKLLQTLSFLTLFLMLANQLVHSQRDVSFSYDKFTQNTLGLNFQGWAHVPEGSTFVRLCQWITSAGRVLYSQPIQFWDFFYVWPPTFQSPIPFSQFLTFDTTINFLITPFGHAADGLTFFIAPVNTTIPSGATGGNLGIFNGSTGRTPNLFAVEFDNFIDGWDPYFHHIGINIESRISRNTTRFGSATGQLVTARITYNPWTTTISVVATSGSQTASLSYVFDLSTILHRQVQVGISAATGQAAAFNNLISWNFTSSLQSFFGNNDEEAYIRKY
ncbi:hypothetical protein ACS0TY_004985 [Phlomoides rotata]